MAAGAVTARGASSKFALVRAVGRNRGAQYLWATAWCRRSRKPDRHRILSRHSRQATVFASLPHNADTGPGVSDRRGISVRNILPCWFVAVARQTPPASPPIAWRDPPLRPGPSCSWMDRCCPPALRTPISTAHSARTLVYCLPAPHVSNAGGIHCCQIPESVRTSDIPNSIPPRFAQWIRSSAARITHRHRL